MIDLHSHLLPGVDDGSRSVEQSVAVLRRMADRGVTDICLTPHLESSRAEAGVPEWHDTAWSSLSNGALPESIRLHRGMELMLDRPFPEAAASDRRLTLGGSRYLLVEFTRMIAPTAAGHALSRITACGLVPVLAHPERYACCTPAVAAGWRAVGALMQVDATTLFARRTRGERARALLAAGEADILASDNHGDERSVSLAWVLLTEQGGHEQADLLIRANPQAILADRGLGQVPPFTIKRPLLDRLRQLFVPEE